MSTHGQATIDVAETITYLRSQLKPELHCPLVGIVCGSGLSGLVKAFTDVKEIPYAQIPGFATSTGA